jgi:predicted nuclease of predicted toxin-antitoxin system
VKILIDMNLSPEWRGVFIGIGWRASHWSEVGPSGAPDSEIMRWARENDWTVFTHDLDFGALLAATGATGPSVVQLRAEDTRPSSMGSIVCSALTAHGRFIEEGALLTIDPRKMRVTLLPLVTKEK